MQRAVEDRNTKCEAMGEPFVRLELGIGIHTGPVVVGNIGSELKMDYTAIGEPVNIANRLQSLAQAGEIVISAAVRDQVVELVDVEALGPRRLEGLDHEVEAFRIRYKRPAPKPRTPSVIAAPPLSPRSSSRVRAGSPRPCSTTVSLS